MNCAHAICSFADHSDWYLDFTGWRGPLAAALVAVFLLTLGVLLRTARPGRRRVGGKGWTK